MLTPRDPRYQLRKGPKNCEEMKAPPQPIPQASTVTQLFPLKSPRLSLLPGALERCLEGAVVPQMTCLLKRRPLSSQAGAGSRQGEGGWQEKGGRVDGGTVRPIRADAAPGFRTFAAH